MFAIPQGMKPDGVASAQRADQVEPQARHYTSLLLRMINLGRSENFPKHFIRALNL
jgi:hypothetical protein